MPKHPQQAASQRPTNELSSRVEELESRVTFQEDTLNALNQRISEQEQEIAKLHLLLRHLNGKIEQSSDEHTAAAQSANERPPHY